MAIGLGLGAARAVEALTPEAEDVLEALRDRMATGLADEAAYTDFLAGLQEQDGCATWGLDPLAQAAEVWEAMVEACPELDTELHEADRGQAAGRSRRATGSGTQPVQPRRAGPAAPYFVGAGRDDRGDISVSWKENRLYNRRAGAKVGDFTLQAGHLHPDLRPTQLGFVAGSPFYAGWSGGSGFSGPLDSPQAALDGLGLAYAHGDWRLQIAGAWNRLEPRGASIAPNRRDALFHALGLAYRSLRIQAVHQRFEPFRGTVMGAGAAVGAGMDRPMDITVGGLALLDPRDRWHAGGAISRMDSGRGDGAPGGYGEIAWGSRETAAEEPSVESPQASGPREKHAGYRLEAHQATPDWANPLQSPRGYRQDTLDGQWILPGRGEGGFSARSRLALFEREDYRAELESGGEAAWILGEEGLLEARTRLSLIQSLGDWTYTAGTGMRNRRGRNPAAQATVQEGASGFGHILEWKGGAWRARLSLTGRGDDYRGPYPEPLAMLLEHRVGRLRSLGAEAFTGDIRDPAGYLRLILRQEWEMGGGAVLRHSLRLPWSRDAGWAGDLGYQVGVEASL